MTTDIRQDAHGRDVMVESWVEVLPSGDYEAHLTLRWPDGGTRVFGRRCPAHDVKVVPRMYRAMERTLSKALAAPCV